MISQINIAAYICSVLLVLVVGSFLFYRLKIHSKALETGLVGAVGYGMTGYLWGGLLFPIIIVLIYAKTFPGSASQSVSMFSLFLSSIMNAIFTLLANTWGIFLTNQKQKSLYRSSAIGLGYGFAGAIIITGMALKVAISINMGTATGSTSIDDFIAKSFIYILTVGIKLAAATIFYTYMAMILGELINQKKWKQVMLEGMLYYTGFHFILKSLEELLPKGISEGISIFVMLGIGVVCFRKISESLFKNCNK